MGARPTSFDATSPDDVTASVDSPTRVWSDLQQNIFEWFRKEGPHASNPFLMVEAGAGTGKSTTMLEAVGHAPETGILMTAFNKAIADELAKRLDPNRATAKTLHGVGMRYVTRMWPRIQVARGMDRAKAVIDAIGGKRKRLPWQVVSPIAKLMTAAREASPLVTPNSEELVLLAYDRGIMVPDGLGYDIQEVAAWALAAYEYACHNEPDRAVGIDFADMIFLPLRFKLLSKDHPMVVVDETQDMTEAQLALVRGVLATDGRLCIVGDKNQAIYGFRGADMGNMDRLKAELKPAVLPLNVTYRCGRTIVGHANRLVPELYAHESNSEGVVVRGKTRDDLLNEAAVGDFILSRKNAPLAGLCLSLLAEGKRARIKDRDISERILGILTKVKVTDSLSIDQVRTLLVDYEARETARWMMADDEKRAETVRDNCNVLFTILGSCDSVADLKAKCAYLFDANADRSTTITLSSIHRAKGLEAGVVWLLEDTLYTRGITQEEKNLEYVAITRAQHTLNLVVGT